MDIFVWYDALCSYDRHDSAKVLKNLQILSLIVIVIVMLTPCLITALGLSWHWGVPQIRREAKRFLSDILHTREDSEVEQEEPDDDYWDNHEEPAENCWDNHEELVEDSRDKLSISIV